MNAQMIVERHLRALEAGDWETALSYLADTYTVTGTIPFPVSLFVKIRKKDALRMHVPRKRALPDFCFNEQVLEATPEQVKLQINISGTHTGVLDYTGVLRGIPVIPPTGKHVHLASEYFTYVIHQDQIVKAVGVIPKGAGVQGLVSALST